MNHTKNSRGRRGITLRPYLITSMQELNDFRLLVLSREFGFVINLVKKQVAKTTAYIFATALCSVRSSILTLTPTTYTSHINTTQQIK